MKCPLFLGVASILVACTQNAAEPQVAPAEPAVTVNPTGASFSTGPGETLVQNLKTCDRGGRVRPSPVGQITAEDGTNWIVPADTNFQTGPKASDLYNDCDGDQLRSTAQIDWDNVAVMDAGGEEVFTVYVLGDNYSEVYANGVLIATDPVTFTPFNSYVARFKATRPVTLGIMAVDWEENPGLGTEASRGTDHHPGDGGLVGVVKDESGQTVAITDQSWRAQTFYTAPLADRSCLIQVGSTRDSSACSTRNLPDGDALSAAHWPVPTNWNTSEFDDSAWPQAVLFSNADFGADRRSSYTNFRDIFEDPENDADFIWSSNLILDNLVLMRTVIE